jgi:tRNA 2-thiouridine synthesizing protein A
MPMSRERRAARSTAQRTGNIAPLPGHSPNPSTAIAASKPALTLDALGKKCPIPIIMLADRIREIPVGQTIEVLADDPAAKTDLPAWCALKSQEFVGAADLSVGWSFLVRRSY